MIKLITLQQKLPHYWMQISAQGYEYEFETKKGSKKENACFSKIQDLPNYKCILRNTFKLVCDELGYEWEPLLRQWFEDTTHSVPRWEKSIAEIKYGHEHVEVFGEVDQWYKMSLAALTMTRAVFECEYLPIYYDQLKRLGVPVGPAVAMAWALDHATQRKAGRYANSHHSPWENRFFLNENEALNIKAVYDDPEYSYHKFVKKAKKEQDVYSIFGEAGAIVPYVNKVNQSLEKYYEIRRAA